MPDANIGDRPPLWLGLVLAGACVGAVSDLPYAYYQILRLAVTCYAAWIAVVSIDQKRVMWAFGFLAILYNPFIKITLDRDTWAIVNVVTAAFVLIELWNFRRTQSDTEPGSRL
jgi:hypothetical protein